MTSRVEGEYSGEYAGGPYTVQVLPSAALLPTKGQERVVLRISFRALTRGVIAIVGNRRSEAVVHAAVRRRLDAGWPDEP